MDPENPYIFQDIFIQPQDLLLSTLVLTYRFLALSFFQLLFFLVLGGVFLVRNIQVHRFAQGLPFLQN